MIVGWRIRSIEPKVLARWGVIFSWRIGGIEPIWASPGVIVVWWIGDVEPKALARPGIILRGISITFLGPSVNDCCFELFIGLIFGLINGVSYWCTKNLNSDSKKIHIIDIGYIFLYLRRLFLSQIGICSLIMSLAKRWFTGPLGLPMEIFLSIKVFLRTCLIFWSSFLNSIYPHLWNSPQKTSTI